MDKEFVSRGDKIPVYSGDITKGRVQLHPCAHLNSVLIVDAFIVQGEDEFLEKFRLGLILEQYSSEGFPVGNFMQ